MSYPLPSLLSEEAFALPLSWGRSGRSIRHSKKGNTLEGKYIIIPIACGRHCPILEGSE